MNSVERRAVVTLSSILGLRMLGLFLILPVLALYVNDIPKATPLTIGVALGIYGLTQAILQIPFGYFSDRIGRKPMLVIGLLLFTFGSVIAATADSINIVILGRALQGSGAIASVALAFLSDLTREEQRTKAIAILGISIGCSFVIALVLGPILDVLVGLSGIFWTAALLSILAVPAVMILLPQANSTVGTKDLQPTWPQLFREFRQIKLLSMDFGIFVLHMMLTALFVAVPFLLLEVLELPSAKHWEIYVPVLAVAVLGMLPLLRLSMKKKYTFAMLRVGVVILFIAFSVLSFFPASFVVLIVGLWLFFLAFTLLEALMPSLMSRLAPPAAKGTAIGVYNTFHFMGIFVGGILGGWLFGIFGSSGVFIFLAFSGLVWMILVLAVRAPDLLESRTVDLTGIEDAKVLRLIEEFRAMPGVHEVIVLSNENVLYLRVDSKHFHDDSLNELIALP